MTEKMDIAARRLKFHVKSRPVRISTGA